MTISYAKFFPPAVLGVAASALYTVPTLPASNLLRGARVRFSNTSVSAVAVTAYAVPSAGAPAAGNAFLSSRSVPANDYLDVDVPILGPGDSIQALAGVATSITVHAIAGAVYS